MQRESHAPKDMKSFLADQRAPSFLQSDNAKAMKSENMVKITLREKLNENSQNHFAKTKTEPSKWFK